MQKSSIVDVRIDSNYVSRSGSYFFTASVLKVNGRWLIIKIGSLKTSSRIPEIGPLFFVKIF